MIFKVFTQNYFEGRQEVDTLVDVKRLIHENPNNNIRVQIDEDKYHYRLLLHPQIDGQRKIDGYSDLLDTYKYFNNLTEDGLSQIEADDRGAGGVYTSHYKRIL